MSLRETKITETKKDGALGKSESFDPVRQGNCDAPAQQGDDPKKASELFREYVDITKDIKDILTEIHKLSKNSRIDFLSDAQCHLQAIDTVDYKQVRDTAFKTLRDHEPSDIQRAENKKLLDEYVINTKKRKGFLIDYQKAIVVFRESVEKAATDLVIKDTLRAPRPVDSLPNLEVIGSEGAGLKTSKQRDASSLTTTSTGIESNDLNQPAFVEQWPQRQQGERPKELSFQADSLPIGEVPLDLADKLAKINPALLRDAQSNIWEGRLDTEMVKYLMKTI